MGVLCCAELLTTRVWKTEAGVVDKGGVSQPAYLNFEMALNSFPKGPLKVWPCSVKGDSQHAKLS